MSVETEHLRRNADPTVSHCSHPHTGEQDLLLSHPPDMPENPRVLRVVILGAPNAGKSTLSNQLLGRKVCCASVTILPFHPICFFTFICGPDGNLASYWDFFVPDRYSLSPRRYIPLDVKLWESLQRRRPRWCVPIKGILGTGWRVILRFTYLREGWFFPEACVVLSPCL